MARFLTTKQVAGEIEAVIRTGREFIWLVTPYLKVDRTYLRRIGEAVERGVPIHLVTREQDNRDGWREVQSLAELGVELAMIERLHAKCYLNETTAVVTSMNLHSSSEAKSREIGILLDANEDHTVYRDLRTEVEGYLREGGASTGWQAPNGMSHSETSFEHGPANVSERATATEPTGDRWDWISAQLTTRLPGSSWSPRSMRVLMGQPAADLDLEMSVEVRTQYVRLVLRPFPQDSSRRRLYFDWLRANGTRLERECRREIDWGTQMHRLKIDLDPEVFPGEGFFTESQALRVVNDAELAANAVCAGMRRCSKALDDQPAT